MEQNLQIPEKLLPMLKPKRFKIVYGGRGGAKSNSFALILLALVAGRALKVLCLREFMNSIEDSVYSLLVGEVLRLNLPGFKILRRSIIHENGGGIAFKGMARSPHSVKSAHGYDIAWFEEAQTCSQESLDLLIPTIREAGSELWFSLNPISAEDPISARFLVPWLDRLEQTAFHEDADHLVIKINFYDNPWFPEVLEQTRRIDEAMMSPSKYTHVWLGGFADELDNALIQVEWFDACVNAHQVLGFEAVGQRIATHDPSDLGADAKGYLFRHGSVVKRIEEKRNANVNDGCDWAMQLATQDRADVYSWDCDGLGAALNRQTATYFKESDVRVLQYKGSQKVELPKAFYQPVPGSGVLEGKTNEQTFKNKRAQCYTQLRDRMLRTYDAITNQRYHDPALMLSFDTTTIDPAVLRRFRAEIWRLPVKPHPNGLIQLYRKDEMRTQFKIPSPNLADCAAMSEQRVEYKQPNIKRPASLRVRGGAGLDFRRRGRYGT